MIKTSDALDLGLLHEVRPTIEASKLASFEMAQRVAGFSTIGVLQTLGQLRLKSSSPDAIAEDSANI